MLSMFYLLLLSLLSIERIVSEEACSECPWWYYTDCIPLTNEDCPYGIGKDFCDCCDQCLQGSCDYCDDSYTCGDGLECITENCIVAADYEWGTCKSTSVVTPCDTTSDAYKAACAEKCSYGCVVDECTCCITCLQGPCDYCNNGDYECGVGMECASEETCSAISDQSENYEYGYCKDERLCDTTSEAYAAFCSTLNCADGCSVDKCTCCVHCKGGSCESCKLGRSCADGLECVSYDGCSDLSSNSEWGTCKNTELCDTNSDAYKETCSAKCSYGCKVEGCACCVNCLSGPCEYCSAYSSCGNGLECVTDNCSVIEPGSDSYEWGTCKDISLTLPCDTTSEAYEEACSKLNCPYGCRVDPCTCCMSCANGPCESCNAKYTCGNDLECVLQENCEVVTVDNTQDYNWGQCKDTALCSESSEAYTKACSRCPFGCKANKCTCCIYCLNGPDEYCDSNADDYTTCAEHLTCVDEDCNPINIGSESYEYGTCKEIIKTDCTVVDYLAGCSDECSYGCGSDPCDCDTYYCLKEEGEDCDSDRDCAGRLKCCGSYLFFDTGFFPPLSNTCRSVPHCGCDVTCEGYEYPGEDEETCLYGVDESSCSCETKCLKGPEEACGTPFDICANGLTCEPSFLLDIFLGFFCVGVYIP